MNEQTIHFIKSKIASLEREIEIYNDILKRLEKQSIKGDDGHEIL